MIKLSKNLKKLSAFFIGAVLMAGLAMPASAQISSIDELLGKVRQDAQTTKAENDKREREFRSRANQQKSKLASARAELRALEATVRRVERRFDANEIQLSVNSVMCLVWPVQRLVSLRLHWMLLWCPLKTLAELMFWVRLQTLKLYRVLMS